MPKSVSPQDAEYLPLRDASSGQAEISEAADISGSVTPKALKRWSTDELQTAICSGMFDNLQGYEAERILRMRELAPDRKLARRIYNNAAWTLAFSLGTFIVALGIFWLIATAIAYREASVRAMRPLHETAFHVVLWHVLHVHFAAEHVRSWHKADMLNALTNVRYWGQSGHSRVAQLMSANDPKRTYASCKPRGLGLNNS